MICFPAIHIFLALSGFELKNPSEIKQLPGPLLFTVQVIFCMMVEDTVFSFSHRILHHPKLYPTIHKIHHEHRVTFCLSPLHAHPLEYILGNVLPVMLGPALLGHRMHMASMFGWHIVRIWETVDAHCGYSFSWSPFRFLPC